MNRRLLDEILLRADKKQTLDEAAVMLMMQPDLLTHFKMGLFALCTLVLSILPAAGAAITY